METKQKRTLFLAVSGTLLVWLVLLAPMILAVPLFLRSGMWHFDYLMPAELFLIAFTGGSLLVWAASRADLRRSPIGWGLASAALLLVGGQLFATASGLATGAIEPAGWPWALVLTSLGAYCLALALIGVQGALLVRDLSHQVWWAAKTR